MSPPSSDLTRHKLSKVVGIVLLLILAVLLLKMMFFRIAIYAYLPKSVYDPIGQTLDYRNRPIAPADQTYVFGRTAFALPWSELSAIKPISIQESSGTINGVVFVLQNNMKIVFLGMRVWRPEELLGQDPLFRRAMPRVLGPPTNNYEAKDILYSTTPGDISLFSSWRSDKINAIRLILKGISMPSKSGGSVCRFENDSMVGHRLDSGHETTYELFVKNRREGCTILVTHPDFKMLDGMLASLRLVSLPPDFSFERIRESKKLAERAGISPADRKVAILKAVEAITNSLPNETYNHYLSSLYKRFPLSGMAEAVPQRARAPTVQ